MGVQVITFAEFLEKWEKSERLIGPQDYETRPRDQLGIIDGWYFKELSFSDKANEVIQRKEEHTCLKSEM